MGNVYTNRKIDDENLQMSNGLTAVFIDTFCLAGCDEASKPLQKDILIWFAQNSLQGMGCEGFDISQIIWDKTCFEDQKTFILQVIDRVFEKTNWDLLDYSPREDWLFGAMNIFKSMIQKFTAQHIDEDCQIKIYDFTNKVKKYEVCKRHKIYMHTEGCVICGYYDDEETSGEESV